MIDRAPRKAARRTEEGSFSLQYLGILLFAAAVAAAGAVAVAAAGAQERRSRAVAVEWRALEDAALSLLPLLAEDPTPEADDPGDPVMAARGVRADGIALDVRDLSSALNANFVRKGVFEKTDLGRLFGLGKSPDQLQQQREDEGLAADPEAYSLFFSRQALDSAVSVYGWANVNTADEFALRALYRAAVGPAGADAFHAKVQDLLKQRRTLKREELDLFLGADRDALFPLINAEPSMNVNYVDPFVLRQLFLLPDFELAGAAEKAEQVLAAREAGGLDPDKFAAILDCPADHPLLQYFGCVTWFRLLRAERGGRAVELVAARYPEAGPAASPVPRYAIVERRRLP